MAIGTNASVSNGHMTALYQLLIAEQEASSKWTVGNLAHQPLANWPRGALNWTESGGPSNADNQS